MKQPFLSAIVLAGGQSRRMGQDKALLQIAGQPLLQQICDRAAQCCSVIYVVTAWPDRYRSFLPETCQCVVDRTMQGPLVGFAQGLAGVQTKWVLLLACDMPSLDGALMRQWAQELPTLPETSIAYLARHTKGWEPFGGFYRVNIQADLNQFIQQGGKSFQQFLQQRSITEISNVMENHFLNCNSPQDWASLRSTME
ncbi:molybdenum cofactor guanylyltransferase [Alkalinema pantanalense CENA528]|uniref:molybdenum cofactor guanylyltransferase n=1 Tax=Alkalinema pantanalense TaxID=1620705 RepID=UPI003D6E43A7